MTENFYEDEATMNKKQREFIRKYHKANADELNKHTYFGYASEYSEFERVHLNLEGLIKFASAFSAVDSTPDDLYCIKRSNGSLKTSDLTFDQATNYLHGMMLNVIDLGPKADIIKYNKSEDLTYEYQGTVYSYKLESLKEKTQNIDDFYDQWPP